MGEENNKKGQPKTNQARTKFTLGRKKNSKRPSAESAPTVDVIEPEVTNTPGEQPDVVNIAEEATESVPNGEIVNDEVATVVETEAETKTDEAAGDPTGATAESVENKYPVLKAESTTQLIFFAPELPEIPVPDEQSDAGRRRQRSRGTSEDRSARNNRRTQDSADGQQDREPKTETKSQDSRSERPTQLRGSTRLEAKRQRRRENRDANRRRQVITEVEFQARRESTDRTMVVRAQSGLTEIAVLEDKILAEHYVTRSNNVSLIGNVYLGRVQNVLPSMEAAFVDIGRGRNAVLYSGEVDWDSADNPGGQRRIELALKSGDSVLVQVTKDPVGHKGARLTSQVSLPGRYLVFVPNGDMNGISRKLAEPERVRLKKILKEIVPENSGVIVRTAAEGASQEQLTLDIKRLTSQWAEIQNQIEKGKPPFLLHSEPDLLTKIIRDVFNEDFQKLVIAGSDAVSTINRYLSQVAPDLLDKVEPYTGNQDVFAEYRVSEQIAKALDRKVWLPSGGSLIIDRTEAMTVIDVNTGKFIGSGGNLEETVTKNNLEAAEEIVRQLRLRDIGGIIVIDFIDMVLESNRDMVLRRLVECLSRDRTKHQVAEVTSLGLVQMTRKKIGLGLAESFEELQSPNTEDQPQQQSQGRKPRQNSRNRNNTGNTGNGQSQAQNHAREITEEVKSAVAQIVASTIHPATGSVPVIEKSEEAPVQPEVVAEPDVAEVKRSTARKQKDQKIQQKAAAQEELASVLDALPPIKPQADESKPARRSRRVTVNFDRPNGEE